MTRGGASLFALSLCGRLCHSWRKRNAEDRCSVLDVLSLSGLCDIQVDMSAVSLEAGGEVQAKSKGRPISP